jgi:hypothetical protein
LLLGAILVVLNYLERGVRINIDISHSISSSYGGFEIKIRDNK